MFFLSVFLPVFFSCYCFCALSFPFRSSPAFLTGARLPFSVLLGSLIQPPQSVTLFLSVFLSFTPFVLHNSLFSKRRTFTVLFFCCLSSLCIVSLSFSHYTPFVFDDSLFSKRRTFTVLFSCCLSSLCIVSLSFSHYTPFVFDDSLVSKRRTFTVLFFCYLSNCTCIVLLSFSRHTSSAFDDSLFWRRRTFTGSFKICCN